MAIQREIWIGSIVEGLFADNSFLSKAYNADEFVNMGKTVHIPNAGAPSKTKKNRTSFPADVNTRADVDLSFNLDEFTTDPIRIPHADTVELSYNKRESVLRQDKATLQESVAKSMIYSWLPEKKYCIETTGTAVDAHSPNAAGKRKALCRADVEKLMTKFNADNIPQEGRYLLLDAYMYDQLLADLTSVQNQAFFASADAQRGILGKLFSFNVMMRSEVAVYGDGIVKKTEDAAGAATDLAAGLAWHENSVCRALGEVNAFEKEKDPTYYGDIYSFLVRAGGRPMREDVKGLIALVQGK
ncbi:hypothetical protein M573_126018 [Prevotella intermedia ZT]|uniref:Major capsid protein n=1 Tax=Prevotella intermedia ZT TaxID=1347790 RepID=A0AAP0YKE1_PREIN|nr:hypothetical protein [Prevotella intermedia]KJJ86413.1 hypothetical protein M573_126018 [Prevotella intermedia ZT]